jgi:hypothetical protein
MLRRAALAIVIALPPVLALAHSMDNGPHGGEVEDANPGPTLHFETVVKGTTVSVYLNDEDGKSIDASGVVGTVTVLAAKQKNVIQLAPAGLNMLTGTGDFVPDPDMRALVSLTIQGVKQQALFSRLAILAQ